MRYAFSFVTGATLMLATASVIAHHAFAAEFLADRPVMLKGTITKVELVNPHAWIHVDVKGVDGTIVSWAIQTGAPNALLRQGFTKNSLPPGTEIVVSGFLARDGSNRANGRDVVLPGGRKMFVGSSGTGAPKDGLDPAEK